MDIFVEFERLINFGLKNKLFEKEDVIFMRNSLIELFKIDEYVVEEVEDEDLENVTPIMNNILDYAYEVGILESNSPVYRDLLDTKIMGLLMPRPSQVINKFNELYKCDEKKATDYLYDLSRACDYVRTSRIAQNMTWKTDTKYGQLDITINLSKPEKDPKAIAAARNIKSASYPKCLLCKENVGYTGRLNHPARQNIRIIPFELQGEKWNLQYSPYSYYNEHCIVLSSEHVPMKISKKTFDRNLEFVEKFPHYFIGSNADLPIVGGSILTHDHYQGGRYEFAMAKAESVYDIDIEGYEDLKISVVKWPLSVIRINGKDREKISELGDKILNHWRNYSDEKVGIYAYTDETPHNTITPISRRRGENYELDLVLRNNRCDDEHPDGIFHPHKELHHIKKENIGLIEVLGLAVLPARLKEELAKVKICLLDSSKEHLMHEDEALVPHLDWFNSIKSKYVNINESNVDSIIENEVGFVFEKVLEDCGVFKWDEEGQQGIKRYLEDLKNCIEKKTLKCKKKVVGHLNNSDIVAYNVKFENGFEVEVLNLGGVITKIITPDKDGNLENIVVAYEDIDDYIENPHYYGAIIGRTGGRICNGKVVIEGKEYQLNKNYGLHQGHGGDEGFNKKIWDVAVEETEEYVLLNLSRVSQDKEENYPGKLYAEVVYKIYKDFKLDIIYKADSDKTTLVNMTNHSYFNLSGNIKRPVTDFNLKLDCDSFLELDETSIPTGKILKVKDNKPFDFTELKSIGKDIDDNNQQIKFGKGYDHAFLLKDDKKIYVEDPKSKRNMTIQTSQDAVVIYTMNSQQKKNTYMGKLPPIRHGICFETQAPPIGKDMCFIDRSILKENEQYLQSTTYSFGLIK